tara:strand:+ start:545 stop:805 length:261 start_codon:yes stop_codon:yes gene_type:complete
MSDFITFPTINLNGNDKDKLQGQYQEALDKIRESRESIGKIDLHGRDYPNRDDYPKAHDEFIAHLVAPVQEAESYLESIVINISQQ